MKSGRTLRTPTVTNGVLSPTGTTRWRTTSPVYTYRTGWLPPSRAASRDLVTSPQSQQVRVCDEHGRVAASSSSSGTSRVKSNALKSEQPSNSSTSLLETDSVICDAVWSSSHHELNGSFESEGDSTSSPVQHYQHTDDVPGLNGTWAEKKNLCTVNTDSVLSKSESSLSSQGVETAQTSRHTDYSSSAENTKNSLPCPAAENNTVTSDGCSEVEVVDHNTTLPSGTVPSGSVELVKEQTESTAITQPLPATDDDDDVTTTRYMGVTSSPLNAHDDLHVLLSARRTSVDYFQKVLATCLRLRKICYLFSSGPRRMSLK